MSFSIHRPVNSPPPLSSRIASEMPLCLRINDSDVGQLFRKRWVEDFIEKQKGIDKCGELIRQSVERMKSRDFVG